MKMYLPDLEITEVVPINYNVVHHDYQQDSRVLCRFVPNESFGQFIRCFNKIFCIFKTFNLEFLYIEVLFTDQNSKPLEMPDIINITLVIN